MCSGGSTSSPALDVGCQGVNQRLELLPIVEGHDYDMPPLAPRGVIAVPGDDEPPEFVVLGIYLRHATSLPEGVDLNSIVLRQTIGRVDLCHKRIVL